MRGTQTQESTVNPTKWLATMREWVPAEPLEVVAALINSLIEASGPSRVEGIDELIAHTARTTRSGREKFERLRQWHGKMRADPRYWPQIFLRPRKVSVLISAILDKSPRPLKSREVEQKYRKSRKVPPSGLSQELKEMARRGEIDRVAAGLYWRKGTAVKAYESQPQQLYRLVHDAAGHRMPNAELALAMNISRTDLETLLAQIRKRWGDPPLIEHPTGNGITVALTESIAVLKRDGRILDGRGGTFFSAPNVIARAAEGVTFTTLRHERPPVDLEKLAQEVERIKGLKKRERIVEIDALAKAFGVPHVVLELMVRPAAQLVKHTERKAIVEAAKEKWRAAYRALARAPEHLPTRAMLWEEARGIPGLTRQIFREVISEEGPGKSGPRPGIRAEKVEKSGANSG